MIKHIIGNPYQNNDKEPDALGDFSIVLHAAPGETGRFDWRIKANPNARKYRSVLVSNGFESITLAQGLSRELFEKNKGCFLYCHVKTEGEEFDSDGVFLFPDFQQMLFVNKFDTVSYFDGNGMGHTVYRPCRK